MQKTTLMLLVEERAGKDLREVLAEAFEAGGGSLIKAAEWIRDTYGTSGPSYVVFREWVQALGGEVRKTVEFPEVAVP